MSHDSTGLKCGIEIHQQLDCGKLFCGCSSSADSSGGPDLIVKRRIRAVAGESWEVDRAAAHEMSRGREFVYEGNDGTCCLVELDEEPPHQINARALETAAGVAIMLNSELIKEVQVMRKTVVDGSNTAGFQRTALVATGGFVDTKDGRVGIGSVCLEEDACRILGSEGGTVHYHLDRLGIPLIEIGTLAEIKCGEQAMEVAKKLGMVLRAFPSVKRGLGTIRQDLNVSIRGGARVEMKGVQQLKDIPLLVDNEVERQKALLKLKDELKTRESGVGSGVDVGVIFEKTGCKVIADALRKDGIVTAVLLKNFKGLLKFELLRGHRLGTELAGIARSFSLGGLFHSDELPAYGITANEVNAICKALGARDNDAFLLVAGPKTVVLPAVEAVVGRCKLAMKGVPEETRKAGGTISVYMRPLPGAARMYPETDVKSVAIDDEFIARVSWRLPKSLDERRIEIEGILNKELANQIVNSRRLSLFERFVGEFKLDQTIVASVLLNAPKDFSDEQIEQVIELLGKGRIAKESVESVYEGMAGGETAYHVAEKGGLFLLDEKEAKSRIEGILENNQTLVEKKDFGAIMGAVMSKLRGKVDVELIKRIVREKTR